MEQLNNLNSCLLLPPIAPSNDSPVQLLSSASHWRLLIVAVTTVHELWVSPSDYDWWIFYYNLANWIVSFLITFFLITKSNWNPSNEERIFHQTVDSMLIINFLNLSSLLQDETFIEFCVIHSIAKIQFKPDWSDFPGNWRMFNNERDTLTTWN